MLDESTIEKVQEALSLVTEIPITEIHSDHNLVEDLHLDSLSVVILSITLEEKFGESLLLNEWVIAAEDPNQLTVRCLAEHIHEKLQLIS